MTWSGFASGKVWQAKISGRRLEARQLGSGQTRAPSWGPMRMPGVYNAAAHKANSCPVHRWGPGGRKEHADVCIGAVITL